MEELRRHYAFLGSIAGQGRLSSLRWIEAKAGTQLIAKGDRVGGVYLVAHGALRVYHVSPEGRESTLYWVEPGGSCIAAMNCVFGDMSYPAWVAVESDVRVALIPSAVYREFFEQDAAVRRFTFDILSGRVLELMTNLAEAFSFGVEQRFGAFLLRKADGAGVVEMSQETMANHLGTAREVVSRAVRSFTAQGLVTTRRGAVVIADAEGLRRLVGEV